MSRCLPLLVVVVAALAACSSSNNTTADGPPGSHDGPPTGPDAFVPQDSPPGPFGCLNHPVSMFAPDPIVIAGVADTVSGTSIVTASGVTVVAEDDNGTALGSAVTDGSGTYSISVSTGGKSEDIHMQGTHSGDRDTTLFPATAFYESSSNADIVIISQDDFNLIAEFSGVTQDASNGAVGVVVLDCDGNTLSGAVVSIPGGDVVYVMNDQPDTSATSTDTTGVALVFNVPPGSATLSATVGGMTLRSHTIQAAAGVTTTATIRP